MTKQALMNGIRRWWIVLLILGIVLAVVFIILTPWNISNLSSHPRPVQSYAEAVQRIEILQGQEPADMNPVCQLQLMTHDKKVDRVIILFMAILIAHNNFRCWDSASMIWAITFLLHLFRTTVWLTG